MRSAEVGRGFSELPNMMESPANLATSPRKGVVEE